jgi:hypothetical protein
MAERRLHGSTDAELEAALRSLAPAVGWPSASGRPGEPDLAATVRARIQAAPPSRIPASGRVRGDGWRIWTWRPARRALVLALVALLAIVAIVGAIGLGLPGLRITLGLPPPGVSPLPSLEPSASPPRGDLGASLGLGEPLDAHDAAGLDARAGFHVRWPTDPAVGAPETAYIDDRTGGQVTLLWPTRAGLPPTLEPGVGLLLSQFQGAVEEGFFTKAVHGGTTVDRIQVDGQDGFWLHGDPHVFFWQSADGFVDDRRRWVGDVLLWAEGPITYRLETSLGRDAAIRIAESMR